MAYAAVISLKQTIKSLLNPSRISTSTQEILKIAHNETASLQQVLERLNDSSRSGRSNERLDDLEGQIRGCAHQLEDVLELNLQLYSQQHHENFEDHEDLEEVRQEITSFVVKAKKMKADYLEELQSSLSPIPEDDDDDDGGQTGHVNVSPNIDHENEMVGVGRSRLFNETRDYLVRRMRPDDMCVISLVGEAGTGWSVIAKTIFNEQLQQSFDCGAWVRIGTEYQLKDILMSIISQVADTRAADQELLLLSSRENEEIGDYLYTILEQRRYMIVLDDIRDVQAFDCLKKSLPDQGNGSVLILTTTLKELAQSASLYVFYPLEHFYQEISGFILRDAMFRNHDPFSHEFKESGNKIAENCRGRTISLAKTLLLLFKTEKTPEQWTKIAADRDNPVFIVRDEISEFHEIKTEIQSFNWVPDVDSIETQWISKLIDYSNTVIDIKRKMFPKRLFDRMEIICFIGMAGIGKTTFVKNVFDDESVLCHHDCRAWVYLGPTYQAEEILIDILAQIYPSIDKLHMKGDEKLVMDLCSKLSDKRCLVVLDDIWSKEPVHLLKKLFPNIRGRALLTTRLSMEEAFGEDDVSPRMQLLNKEDSWSLLRQKVFGEGYCPPQLEKIGRKIANNCEGLPLLILKVADQLLLENNKTPEYWNNVILGKQNSVFKNAYDEISDALLPSYKKLPQHLKTCFLYMGVFHKSYDISKCKITNMLVAEGFLEPANDMPAVVEEEFVANCLTELAHRSLVMVLHKDSSSQIKGYRLHSVFWHLSNSEDVNNNFFHAMNKYADCSIECLERQRRLCIRNCVLLGMEDVQNVMASLTTTRSLLCVCPPHKYPVPISFGMRLLRVMDALTIRLYEFPDEVVKLIHLRYLALTFHGNLPTSISKLWKLQHLIVGRYLDTNSFENSLPLPVEIWDMKELKHLQIMGGCLPVPNPECGNIGLPKLSTLLDLSAESCTEKVLEMIPNLKRLGIRIELDPDGDGDDDPFQCLKNISRLSTLESLKCVVLNPDMGYSEDVPPPTFPSSLQTLSLSGFGYPWRYMNAIGRMEKLQVLKLKHYAFQGSKWKMDSSGPFTNLKFLQLEDSNLVHWEIKSVAMPRLQRLSIKHCYQLDELPTYLPCIYLNEIEIVDCNPLTLSWAENLRTRRPDKYNFQIQSHLSWTPTATKNE